MRTRRRVSAEFKAKVALVAIKGQRRLRSWRPSTTASDQIAAWKREPIEKLAKVFDEKGSAREQSRDAELTRLARRSVSSLWREIVCRKAFDREPGPEGRR